MLPLTYGYAFIFVSRGGAYLTGAAERLVVRVFGRPRYRRAGETARCMPCFVWCHRTEWGRTVLAGELLSMAKEFVQVVLAVDADMSPQVYHQFPPLPLDSRCLFLCHYSYPRLTPDFSV